MLNLTCAAHPMFHVSKFESLFFKDEVILFSFFPEIGSADVDMVSYCGGQKQRRKRAKLVEKQVRRLRDLAVSPEPPADQLCAKSSNLGPAGKVFCARSWFISMYLWERHFADDPDFAIKFYKVESKLFADLMLWIFVGGKI